MDVLDNARKIKIGDAITIRILEDRLEALDLKIAATGKVHAPYIGLLPAEGLTCRELAYTIKAELEKHFFKIATVVLIFKSSTPEVFYDPNPNYVPAVTVSGSVSKEGKYTLLADEDTTVSSLITRAGGPTAIHGISKIRVIRMTPLDKKTILVNIKALLGEKNSEYDLPLRPSDVMIVE